MDSCLDEGWDWRAPPGVSTWAQVQGWPPRSESGEGRRNTAAGQYTALTAPLRFCTKACTIASIIKSFKKEKTTRVGPSKRTALPLVSGGADRCFLCYSSLTAFDVTCCSPYYTLLRTVIRRQIPNISLPGPQIKHSFSESKIKTRVRGKRG